MRRTVHGTSMFQAASTNDEARPLKPIRPSANQITPRSEPSPWMVVPVVLGVAALLLLGLHPPEPLQDLLARGAAELTGAVR